MSASETRAILDGIKARSGGTLDDFRPSSRAGQIFRMASGVYQCIALQLSRSGRSLFCIELGMTFEFMFPNTIPRDLYCADCEIRRRLAPDNCRGDHWWNRPVDDQALDEIAALVHSVAVPFLETFRRYPEPLAQLTPADINQDSCFPLFSYMPRRRVAMLLARFHVSQQNLEKAKEFAKLGIDEASPRATSLIEYFRRIINADSVTELEKGLCQ